MGCSSKDYVASRMESSGELLSFRAFIINSVEKGIMVSSSQHHKHSMLCVLQHSILCVSHHATSSLGKKVVFGFIASAMKNSDVMYGIDVFPHLPFIILPVIGSFSPKNVDDNKLVQLPPSS